jgi:hypothetical protein
LIVKQYQTVTLRLRHEYAWMSAPRPPARRKNMTRKPNIPAIRRQLRKIEKTLYAASDRIDGERGRRLGRAADLLVEIRACEIHGMR